MGQIVKFPKEPRSEVERWCYEANAKSIAERRLPPELIDRLAKNVAVAMDRWMDGELKLSYAIPGHFSPEVVQEIERIAALASRDTRNWMVMKALIERFEFELALIE